MATRWNTSQFVKNTPLVHLVMKHCVSGLINYITLRTRTSELFRWNTVEPPCNEGPRDCQNLFAKPRFRYIEVLFHIFYYYWSSEDRSSNRGLHYIEVRYIEVLLYSWLYLSFKAHKTPFPFLISRKDMLKLNTITIDMMTSDVLSEKDKKHATIKLP